jgi:hypothetical protein
MRAAIEATAHAVQMSRRLNVRTRVAVVGRLFVLAEALAFADRPPLVMLAEALRDCEAAADKNGDTRLALILRDARGEASAHAAYALQWAA